MAGRIILFGATGYTGELTARAMAAAGLKPVLAARNPERLKQLAEELGSLSTAIADVTNPRSIESMLEPGDTLVTTVGPFAKLGLPAFEAALQSGAHYVDSTGEPAWIRQVFSRHSEVEAAGTVALTAFGYDFVPGTLAAAIALDRAGADAVAVDVGYFFKGGFGSSGGTRASLVGALLEPGHEWRAGAIQSTSGATKERSFRTTAGQRTGLGIGASEHFAIPRIAPTIDDVGVYLGWFGNNTAPARYGSAAISAITKLPGAKSLISGGLSKLVKGSTGGPNAEERAGSRSLVVAEALAANGTVINRVELEGPNGYDLTASFLTWAASELSTREPLEFGSLGPTEPFGLKALIDGCAQAGLTETA